MKKGNFLLVIFGILFLVFNRNVSFPLNDESFFVVDVIPDVVGYLLILLGVFPMRERSRHFGMSALFAVVGMILSGAVVALSQRSSGLLAFELTKEIAMAVVLLATVIAYLNGLRSAANQMGDAKGIGHSAALYRWLFLVSKVLSVVLICLSLWLKMEVVSLWISIPLIFVSALNYAFLIMILLLSLRSMGYFPQTAKSVEF